MKVSCEHAGVRLVEQRVRPQVFGVSTQMASWIGLVCGLLAVMFCALTGQVATWWIAGAMFLVGAGGQLVGASIVRLARALIRFIS